MWRAFDGVTPRGGPKNLINKKLPGDTDAASTEPVFENQWLKLLNMMVCLIK